MEPLPDISNPVIAVGAGVPLIGAVIGFFRHIFSRIAKAEEIVDEKAEQLRGLIRQSETDLRHAIEEAIRQTAEEHARLREESNIRFGSIQAQLNDTAKKADLMALSNDIKSTIQLLLPRN